MAYTTDVGDVFALEGCEGVGAGEVDLHDHRH